MLGKLKENPTFKRVFYFFPVQLLFVHLKKSHMLLLFWLIVFGFITKNIAEKYGAPDLFLHPEYIGKVGFWSYFIVGFACGGFIMAFNISSYIINGFRFPFLATLSRPFVKYCLNNSIVPVFFILIYTANIIISYKQGGYDSNFKIFTNVGGFLIGTSLFIFLALYYFLSTNKDLFRLFGISTDEDYSHKRRIKPVKDVFHKRENWTKRPDNSKEWKIETYLSQPFKVKLSRDCSHYDRKMLEGVFQQNHINAAFFQIAVIASLLLLGFFREVHLFKIPAAATVFLMFTMFLMLSSALHSWLRGWSTSIYILLIIVLNYFSGKDVFNFENRVYGLNYEGKRVEYSNSSLVKHFSDKESQKRDYEANLEILNKWRLKNSTQSIISQRKPKLVIVCVSGGGLRASLWSLHSLQYLDSSLNGKLLSHTQMMCGSSGGMIGAAYLREVYLRSLTDSTIKVHDPIYKEKIAKDLLNPVVFSIAVNDLFIRLQKFKDGNYVYVKDRGYAFEKQLNENTDNFLNKRLRDYYKPEKDGLIPLSFFAPAIVNDGRRLLIASQPAAYMTNLAPSKNLTNHPIPETVEFKRFFKNQDADNLLFTSALRVNATFPYIFPTASLPSTPSMEVMDGGLRDNYGFRVGMKYLYEFRNWISSNTSGVIILQIRDQYKEFEVANNTARTRLETMLSPIGTFYGTFDKIQRFNHDELIQLAGTWFDGQIDVIDFQLKNTDKMKISMSWHLSPNEKKNIMNEVNLPENQKVLEQLKVLLE